MSIGFGTGPRIGFQSGPLWAVITPAELVRVARPGGSRVDGLVVEGSSAVLDVTGHRSLRDCGLPKFPTLAGWRLLAVAGLQGLDGQGRGKVAFARAGRSEKMHHLGAVDELELGQRQDAVAIERGLKAKSKPWSVLIAVRRAIRSAVLTRRFSRKVSSSIRIWSRAPMPSISPCSMRRGGIEHFECAGHPEPDEAPLDAVDRCGGSVGHERPPMPPARCSPMA